MLHSDSKEGEDAPHKSTPEPRCNEISEEVKEAGDEVTSATRPGETSGDFSGRPSNDGSKGVEERDDTGGEVAADRGETAASSCLGSPGTSPPSVPLLGEEIFSPVCRALTSQLCDLLKDLLHFVLAGVHDELGLLTVHVGVAVVVAIPLVAVDEVANSHHVVI